MIMLGSVLPVKSWLHIIIKLIFLINPLSFLRESDTLNRKLSKILCLHRVRLDTFSFVLLLTLKVMDPPPSGEESDDPIPAGRFQNLLFIKWTRFPCTVCHLSD